ncbi:hypothetical protein SCUCBS95973_003075 [Sporothrix curviconia]|uniref:Zn(2)-C6 fungal-type domain-containing protein n=1 Tax=Sporothrix curviconia TaxID=1260050 RepID=A0ABP0BCM4_9PEZI
MRSHACDRCKRRKVRCNGQDPCSQCSRGHSPCERRTALRRPGPRVSKRPADAAGDAGGSERDDAGTGTIAVAHPLLAHASADSPLGLPAFSPTLAATSPESIIAPDNLVWGEYLRVRAQLNARSHALLDVHTEARGIEEAAHGCVDLFLQFLFPNTPIAHEPTLRASIPLLSFCSPADPTSPDTSRAALSTLSTIATVRRFTLITALCAHIISVVPTRLSRLPKALGVVFFDASRAMLHAYEAYDLEHPDATSLTIRMWHSSCAQNTTGKVGASFHYHTEACCLAQRLRLYDEASLRRVAGEGDSPQDSLLEARLLRANFWHLYMAEKTQMAFRTRAPIIDERICYGGITLRAHHDGDGDGDDGEVESVPLLDQRQPHSRAGLEQRIFAGFHLRRRIAATAAALIDDIASCGQRRRERDAGSAAPAPAEKDDAEVSALVERHLHFAALINDVPSWVMHPDRDVNPRIPSVGGSDSSTNIADSETSEHSEDQKDQEEQSTKEYHATCFWAQYCNILPIFHCMRLLVVQACIDHSLPVVVGLAETAPWAWASRKLEIVRDFLHGLQATPFVCLEAQGETAVDKVRRVGTILLELLHKSDNATIKAQAETLFKSLLDILSRLDSKACEGL